MNKIKTTLTVFFPTQWNKGRVGKWLDDHEFPPNKYGLKCEWKDSAYSNFRWYWAGPFLSLVLLMSISTQAGTLKIPTGQLKCVNAGSGVPISFSASGWPVSARVQVYLVSALTWQSTWMTEVALKNGANTLSIPIDWSWDACGSYVIKLVSGSTCATGTQIIKIRPATITPYGGTVWHPGQSVAVTWMPIPPFVDYYLEYFEVYLLVDGSFDPFVIEFEADPRTGRLDFVVPSDVPPGTYRIHLDGFATEPYWDEELLGWDYWPTMEENTRSERIIIQ